MKAAEARRLAETHSSSALSEAAEALGEEKAPAFEVQGEDDGERLTHVLLALRIRSRMDDGESARDAFRHVMAGVRDVLTNG